MNIQEQFRKLILGQNYDDMDSLQDDILLPMTKEEIQQAKELCHSNKIDLDRLYKVNNYQNTSMLTWAINGDISRAQSQLNTKNTAIAFAEWIQDREGEEKLTLIDGDWYYDIDEEGSQPLSATDLYNLFIHSQVKP